MSANAGESGTNSGRMPKKETPVRPQSEDTKKFSELEKETGAGVQTSQDQSQQPIKPPKQ